MSSPSTSASSSSHPSPSLRHSAQMLSSHNEQANDPSRADQIELAAPIADIEEYDDEAKVKLLNPSDRITSTVVIIPESSGSSSRNSRISNDEAIQMNGNANPSPNRATNGNVFSNGNSFIVSLNQKLIGAKQWWNGTPTTNGAGPKRPKNVELLWRNLSYEVKQFKWSKFVRKPCSVSGGYDYRRLLDSVSGSIRSGELVAIMGPSGAGKTTLIECISGRRKIGVSGEIVVSGGGKRTKLAYNAQDDSLMPCLTVYETLLFASKLRNYQRNNRLKVKLVDDTENVYNATTYPDSDLVIRYVSPLQTTFPGL